MREFAIIGQDGTKYVFKADNVDVVANGKKVFVNGKPLAEYFNAGDACEAAATLIEELESYDTEYLLPVKHFQAEPFIECAWARESIEVFLEVVKKLPHDFIDEFFRSYKCGGLEEACKVAKEVTEIACACDKEMNDQADRKKTVFIEKRKKHVGV